MPGWPTREYFGRIYPPAYAWETACWFNEPMPKNPAPMLRDTNENGIPAFTVEDVHSTLARWDVR